MLTQLKKNHKFHNELIKEFGIDLSDKLKQLSYYSIYDLETITFSFRALKKEFDNSSNGEIIKCMKDYLASKNPHPVDRALMIKLGCF